jgi:O-antigen/teichoic acid export membrane protein
MKPYLARGGLAIIDQVLVSANSFVTIVLVAKFCGAIDVSLYALGWAIFNVARVIQERAISASYVVFAHQQGRTPATFLGSSLLQQVALGSLAMLFFLLLSSVFYIASGTEGLGRTMATVAIASPFVLMRDHLRSISCSHFRYGTSVALNASAFAIQIGIILALHKYYTLNAPLVFASMGVASLIPCAVWFSLRPQEFKFDALQALQDSVSTYTYSKWLVAARAFPTVAFSLLPWMAYWLIDQRSAGVLATCLTLANLSTMFVIGANNFFQPRTVQAFHRDGAGAMAKILLESSVFFGLTLSLFTAVLWIQGDVILTRLFGATFGGNKDLVGLLALHSLIITFSTVAGNGMAALGKPRGLFWGEVGYALVIICVGTVFISKFGLMGAGIAMCCAAVVSTVIAVTSFIAVYPYTPDASSFAEQSE